MANLNQRTMYGANLGAQVSPPSGTDSGDASTYPTVDHVDTGSSPVEIDPTTNLSFVNRSFGPTSVELTLADGETDGFLKTIRCGNTVEWTIVPANLSDGASVVIDASEGNGPGSVTFAWNADLGTWTVVALYNGVVP